MHKPVHVLRVAKRKHLAFDVMDPCLCDPSLQCAIHNLSLVAGRGGQNIRSAAFPAHGSTTGLGAFGCCRDSSESFVSL
ncbi:hypothetical protein RB213_016225 [Colletotrichum asianum]